MGINKLVCYVDEGVERVMQCDIRSLIIIIVIIIINDKLTIKSLEWNFMDLKFRKLI